MSQRSVSRGRFERASRGAARAVPDRYARPAELGKIWALLGLVLSSGLVSCGGQSGSPEAGTTDTRGDVANAETSNADALTSGHTPSAEQIDAAVVIAPDTFDRADPSGGAWRVIEVPAAGSLAGIVRTPSGWMALSSRFLGPDAKVITGVETALYRSSNGVHWQAVPIQSSDLELRELAYGAGHYVMVGSRFGGEGVVLTSSDGEHWTESSQSLSEPFAWKNVAFVRDRFFAFGFQQLAMSDTGQSWEALPTHILQGGAGAYGNGRYLLLGNGPMQTSEDGRAWQEHSLDCNLPRACITNPSGGVAQGYHHAALFAEGRFHTEELSSPDGASWEAEPGLIPGAYIGGHFVGTSSLSAGLAAWTSEGPIQTLRVIRPAKSAETEAGRDGVGGLDGVAPLPETVDVPFEDGLTCETADCIIVGQLLLLVPPLGTPPLVDRVPRDADGAPLLTRDCPVSSMIFCTDYAARSGCVCNPEAPHGPDSCDDVSQYRCAGQFVARANEWQLEELAQAGCSCDATDPSEPVGFGRSCSSDGGTCQAPLECLGIDTPPWPAPEPQPFVCTSRCSADADCPSWDATGFCSGPVHLRCSGGTCQPRTCD